MPCQHPLLRLGFRSASLLFDVQVVSTMGNVVWREKLEEAVSAADAVSSALVRPRLLGVWSLGSAVVPQPPRIGVNPAMLVQVMLQVVVVGSVESGNEGVCLAQSNSIQCTHVL